MNKIMVVDDSQAHRDFVERQCAVLYELAYRPGYARAGYDRPRTVSGVVKVGRNDPCPCGSGKKYKKCCLGK